MKTLLTGLLLLFTVSAFAANPAFESFPTNQFNRNNVTLTYRDGKTLFVDNVFGDDSKAHRTNGIPFKTPVAAKTNALAGDLIVVREGVYANGVTNLFKGDVDWHFMNCELQWTDPTTNGHGSGFFDDRYSGAVTSTISGTVTLRYSTGTNGYWGDLCEPHFGNMVNGLGAIVLTNANTLVSWVAATKVYIYGASETPSALYVENCKSDCYFNLDEIFNGSPWPGSNQFIRSDCPADPGTDQIITVGASAIYWGIGSFGVRFKRIWPMTLYALNAYSLTTNDVADLYMDGEICEGKIYVIGLTPTYKTWINVSQLRTTNAGAYEVHGSGTHYLTAQKVSEGGTGAAILTANNGDNPSNQVVHLNVEKVASHTGAWIDSSCGTLRGYIGHFETTTNNLAAGIIARTNGTIDLSGQYMSNALYCVNHIGGYNRLDGYRIISTNRPAVFLNGPGFIGQNIATVSPTNSFTATNAQSMKLYGHSVANTNEHSNVTIQTGSLSVNGEVQ